MIQPVKMSKIRVVGPKKFLKKAIEIMHSEAVVHLEDFKPGKYNIEEFYFDIGSPFQEASKYSSFLIRLRSLIASLKIDKQQYTISELPKESEKILAKVESDFGKLAAKLKEVDEKKKEFERAEEPLLFLSLLNIEPKTLIPLENIAVYKGYCEQDFEPKLKELTNKYELKKGEVGKQLAFVLFIDRQYSDKAKEILDWAKYKEINIPEKIEHESAKELENEIKELDGKEKKLLEQVEDLKEKKAGFIVSFEDYLRRENEKAEAPLKFGATSNTFIVQGFIPVERYEGLQQKLVQSFGNKIHVEKFETRAEFAPPTKLENPSLVGSFEFFLELYSLPSYKELDPTFLIFIAFPLFFGFMLGDIGYGIATAVLFAAVKLTTKSRAMKGIMNAMLLASGASILFGFVFGEFFGGQYFGLKPIIHRETDIELMILITLLVGIIHMNIGYLFGFINAKRMHGWGHALKEKIPWIIIEAGIILLLFKMLNIVYTTMPYQIYAGFALLGIGAAIMVAVGHGIEVMEMASVLTNLLSYTRLFALGLASVALAAITNEFATEFIHEGGIAIAAGIGILIAGHLLNIAIGIIGGFLQALRLHYVEFFTKFYKGEGKKYNPFGG